MKKSTLISCGAAVILGALFFAAPNVQAQHRPHHPTAHRPPAPAPYHHAKPAPPPHHHAKPAPPPHHRHPAPPPPHHARPHHHPAPPPPPPHHHPHHHHHGSWGSLIGDIIDAAIHESRHHH